MEKIIVYLDDAEFAQRQLTPMRTGEPAPGSRHEATHWVLVACAPRMSQHVSKWVSHSARKNWRAKWAGKLFAQIAPQLRSAGDGVTTVLAEGHLPQLTTRLMAEHGAARVLDARRPKFGQDLQPVTAGQSAKDARWEVRGAVAGMGALLVLAAE